MGTGMDTDTIAIALMDMYGLYGQCAALHADLLHALEKPHQTPPEK